MGALKVQKLPRHCSTSAKVPHEHALTISFYRKVPNNFYIPITSSDISVFLLYHNDQTSPSSHPNKFCQLQKKKKIHHDTVQLWILLPHDLQYKIIGWCVIPHKENNTLRLFADYSTNYICWQGYNTSSKNFSLPMFLLYHIQLQETPIITVKPI